MQTDFSLSAIAFAEVSLNEMTAGGPRTHDRVLSVSLFHGRDGRERGPN